MGCKSVATSSREQLTKDFGEFPPSPLTANSPGADFNIVNVGALGARYFTLTRSFRALNQDAADANDPSTAHIIKAFSEIKKGISSSALSFLVAYNALRLYQKILFILLIFIFLPFMLIFFIGFLVRMVFRILRVPVIGTEALGFFCPTTQIQLEIVAKPVEIKRAKINYQSVVSHEHIHLLQYLASAGNPDLRMDVGFQSRVRALVRENVSQEEAAYYLSPYEIEARLHEVVLSFYRESNILPIDYDAFITMINSSEFLGDFTRRIISKMDPGSALDNIKMFKLREVAAARDFALILSRFTDLSTAERFIHEVLPVSYANLLVLYGDKRAAENFIKTVGKTNFYQELYGEFSFV